jgi:UDP-glucose 4-epimerase
VAVARCVVTGGAGFSGSHLLDRLLDGGHQVTAYDDFAAVCQAFRDRVDEIHDRLRAILALP